jgi:hypothetical protein
LFLELIFCRSLHHALLQKHALLRTVAQGRAGRAAALPTKHAQAAEGLARREMEIAGSGLGVSRAALRCVQASFLKRAFGVCRPGTQTFSIFDISLRKATGVIFVYMYRGNILLQMSPSKPRKQLSGIFPRKI